MPLYKTFQPNPFTQILIWEITESFEDLFDEVLLNDVSLIRLNTMKSLTHQLGFLSIRKLLQIAGYSDSNLQYTPSGKPYLTDQKYISISHSNGLAALAISKEPIGIDLEMVKEKALKIAPKFMDMKHLEDLSPEDTLKKATIIWGIKESIFKIIDKVGISFPDHILEEKFAISDLKTKARLCFENQTDNFEIHFEQIKNYVLVYAFEDKNK